MRRRAFLFGAASMALAAPARVKSAGPSIRVGRLSPLSAAADVPMLAGLRRGMREHGWIEGRDFAFEVRTAEARLERLPDLAAELVRVPVNVIVTGSSPGALAAKNATNTIPIVMVTTGDPVAHGLVSSLARPGGNVTGVTALGQDLSAKRLELLKQILPDLTRVAVLNDPGSIYSPSTLQSLKSAAEALNVEIHPVSAHEPGEIERVFAEIRGARAEALLVLVDVLFITYRRQIAALAMAERLPVIYGERESLSDGGLFFYGASLPEMYRRAGAYVDRVLKGAKPADMPVEQPTNFELVLNLKAARELAIAFPQSVLLRADEVIE